MNQHKTIYLAGGCFWGMEEYMSRLDGVCETEVGYGNSLVEYPTYEQVCTGTTGAAETLNSFTGRRRRNFRLCWRLISQSSTLPS